MLGFQLYPFLMAHVASAVVATGWDSNSAQTSLRRFMTSSSLWAATTPVSEPIFAALVSSTSGLTSLEMGPQDHLHALWKCWCNRFYLLQRSSNDIEWSQQDSNSADLHRLLVRKCFNMTLYHNFS